MSTRSDIIVQRADGKWARIYCHWDGYVSNNGVILADHYASQARAEALIKLGDLSSLGPKIGTKHSFEWQRELMDKWGDKPGHYSDDPQYARMRDMCNAYGRDRGEKDTSAEIFDTLPAAWPEADTWTEYVYVWSRAHGQEQGAWYVGNPKEGSQGIVPLTGAIVADAIGNALDNLWKQAA